jgi:hypothetical protein
MDRRNLVHKKIGVTLSDPFNRILTSKTRTVSPGKLKLRVTFDEI